MDCRWRSSSRRRVAATCQLWACWPGSTTGWPLLTGGARDLPERQQTLRATIAWSYDILPPAEQAIFRRLAVFPGGCTLDAAEFVLGDPAMTPAIDDVLGGLSALVDNSLLYVTIDPDGTARYRTLDTVREFAVEMLAVAEREQALERLGAWYLRFATMAHDEMFGPRQGEWLRRIDLEMDNIRGALAWATDGSGQFDRCRHRRLARPLLVSCRTCERGAGVVRSRRRLGNLPIGSRAHAPHRRTRVDGVGTWRLRGCATFRG